MPCGARVAGAFGPEDGVSLVGGAVRDLLLGREPRELDLVVEGDLAAALARLGPGEATVHERFGTATLRTPDGCTVRPRARRAPETYPQPGALPEVRPGDAGGGPAPARRHRQRPGAALPAAGSPASPARSSDLRDGVLRVLHDASFADDPTRLWRVARYAARLGFAVDPHTPRARRRRGPGDRRAGTAWARELRLALREPDPFAALDAAAALHPGLLPPGYAVREDAGRAALALLPPRGPPRPRRPGRGRRRGRRGDRSWPGWTTSASPRPTATSCGAASRAATAAPLHAARTPSAIARGGARRAGRGGRAGRRRERPPLARGAAPRRACAITGDDLLAAGVPRGPEVGERLRRALDAKLDGRAPDRDAELRAALDGPAATAD